MIKPTIGRVVGFWFARPKSETEQPLAAIVAHVWSDACVNLAIFNLDGSPMLAPPTSIHLVQDGDPPEAGSYCTWMPYQRGVAEASAQAKPAA